MAFDPKTYLMQLPRRVKDQATGQWITRVELYLPVKARVMAFRERYPQGIIETKPLTIDVAQGFACFEAVATTGDGGRAVAHGSEWRASFEDFIERSETRAVGRCLGLLGFGTEYATEMDELPHVADAPVAPPNGHAPQADPPAPVIGAGEEPAPPPPEVHPAADEIGTLVATARAANVSNDAFAHDLRRLMNLPEAQKITKKFLRERMTMAQYDKARAHYGQTLAEILNQDVPDFQPSSAAAAELLAPEPTPAPDPDAEAKAKLRADVATWALPVSADEVEYILNRYAPEKARALLWGARKPKPVATPIESAAD